MLFTCILFPTQNFVSMPLKEASHTWGLTLPHLPQVWSWWGASDRTTAAQWQPWPGTPRPPWWYLVVRTPLPVCGTLSTSTAHTASRGPLVCLGKCSVICPCVCSLIIFCLYLFYLSFLVIFNFNIFLSNYLISQLIMCLSLETLTNFLFNGLINFRNWANVCVWHYDERKKYAWNS